MHHARLLITTVALLLISSCFFAVPVPPAELAAMHTKMTHFTGAEPENATVITELNLARLFRPASMSSPNSVILLRDVSHLRAQVRERMDKTPNLASAATKSAAFAYSDAFARQKMFPMAAASYGNATTIEQCLLRTFKDSKLYRNTEVACQGKRNEICAAFTAIAHDDRAIILAFRGTDTFYQLFFETIQTTIFTKQEAPVGGKIGTYFSKVFAQLIEEGKVMDDVAKLLNMYPDYELWVTGHSLGGALAAIAAAHLVRAELAPADRLKLLTFGQPRTGDQQWAEAIDKLLPNFNYRVVHNRDVVPHVPPLWFEGYQHYMTEIFYKDEMSSAEQVVVCDAGDEPSECADDYWWYSTRDHLYYFEKHVSRWGQAGCGQQEPWK